ncbi:MAG: hypothetical protein AAGM22_22820 [Acidobacteriota bacterium]
MKVRTERELTELLASVDGPALRAALREATGMTATAVSNWFSGKTPIRSDRLLMALKLSGVELSASAGGGERSRGTKDTTRQPSASRDLSFAGEVIDARFQELESGLKRIAALEARLNQWLPNIDLAAAEDMSDGEAVAAGEAALAARSYSRVTPGALIKRLSQIESDLETQRLDAKSMEKSLRSSIGETNTRLEELAHGSERPKDSGEAL